MPGDVTPRFNLPFLHAGQAQKEVYHNEALTLIDALAHAHALSAMMDEPPETPVEGLCWIVGALPQGAWAGQAGALACWTGGGWRFIAPRQGMRVRVAGEATDFIHDGETWGRSAIRPAGLFFSDVKVVGARQGAIAPPSGGSTVDNAARTAILAILNALENHGLIEAAE